MIDKPSNAAAAPNTASSRDGVLVGRSFFVGGATFEVGGGGIARVARMTAQALFANRCDLEVLSLLDNEPVNLGAHYTHTVRGSKLRFLTRCRIAMINYRHFVYDAAGVARAHGSIFGFNRPYAVWMHGIEVWDSLRPATRAVLENADLCIVNSEFTLNRYRETHGDLPTARVCWLATEEDTPPAKLANFEGPPIVMILGRIDKREDYKGHAELIASWPYVISKIPDAQLLIVGGGSGLDNIINLVRASPVARSIRCTGFVREADLPFLWQRTHVFAMPSRQEGFGIVYAEAMRYGVPVIASVHDAGQEINVHGQTGFNVDLERVDELPYSLIALLRSPDLSSKMGHAGHERWRHNFCQSAFRSRLIPIMKEFIRKT